MKKSIVLIIIIMLISTCLLATVGCVKQNNVVVGTYREQYLEITLKSDYTFSFKNSISGTTASGEYSYTMLDSGKAKVTLTVKSGSCSYDGGTVYINDSFFPSINGKEIVQRRMYKVK